jgi:hypothetical protein
MIWLPVLEIQMFSVLDQRGRYRNFRSCIVVAVWFRNS